jgi:hypothetical protein
LPRETSSLVDHVEFHFEGEWMKQNVISSCLLATWRPGLSIFFFERSLWLS